MEVNKHLFMVEAKRNQRKAIVPARILLSGKPILPGELEPPENYHALTCTLLNCLAMNEIEYKILDT